MKISVVSLSTENELVRNVLLAVLASLAKLEREKISQRMKAGLETSDREKLRKPLDTGVALSLSYVSESEAGTKAKSGERRTVCWRGVDSNFGFRNALSHRQQRGPWSRRLIRR